MHRKPSLTLPILILWVLVGALCAKPPVDWSGPGKWWNHSFGPDSGSATEEFGVLTVKGGGPDVWDTSDGFHFVFKHLTGDGSIAARVVRIGGPAAHEWRKAGVMIRQDLTAGSANVMMEMTPTSGHAWCQQWRTTAAGSPGYAAGGSMALPYWVRLDRSGSQLAAYSSPDGVSWTAQGTPQTVSMTDPVYIGLAVTSHETGTLCEAAFDNVTFTGQVKGCKPDAEAAHPVPATGAMDVPRDATLGWSLGQFAKTHDVYLGTVFDDVNTATRATPKAVLVSQGQDANAYDPAGLFAFGQTYYWRVDEVNSPDSPGIYPGETWTFAAEPLAYAVKPISATASSTSNAAMGPLKTIDGLGLNANDEHSTTSTQMWISKKGQSPAWIQYEFDKAYKLHEMWVWNSNQTSELDVGIGAMDGTIETSLDGATWTRLDGVPQFSQATGEPNYVHNTTVDFKGVLAKYVKLTIAQNWGGLIKQYSLSEVRFFYVPVKAFGPSPTHGATGVALDGLLSWRPGREAVKHQVTLGSDAASVASGTATIKTVTEHTLGLGDLGLDYGRTYYWRVNEVNDAATPKTWEGDVWSFTAIGYAVVEDFESYNDTCSRIFFSWVDGFGHSGSTECGVPPSGGNHTGSTVGNVNPPFAERTLVHSGNQSMPLFFDNAKAPFYSETQRDWSAGQSWMGGGVNTLVVTLRGDAAAFLETSPGTFIMNGTGTDIWDTADELRFAYRPLKGNGSITVRVDSVASVNEWSKACVMIRETLESGSKHATVGVTPTPSHGVSFQRRLETGGASSNTDVNTVGPYWVRLTRTGNAFTAQRSVDGSGWLDIAVTPAVTIQMATDVYIGLAVTSHVAGVPCGARFSNVSTMGAVSGAWQVAQIGAVQTSGNAPEAFYVAVADRAGKIKVITHPDPTVMATGFWEEWKIPLSQFAAAGVNLSSLSQMVIGVGDRGEAKAGGAGRLYIDDIRLTRTEP